MFGVWPLQVLFIAAFVGVLCERLPNSAIRRWALRLLVTAIVGANLVVLSRTGDWLRGGWSRGQPDLVEAIGYPHVLCEPRPQ